MVAHITRGSPEHFQQVLRAHVVPPWSMYCRCGANAADYRRHIEQVWRPFPLPEGWMEG